MPRKALLVALGVGLGLAASALAPTAGRPASRTTAWPEITGLGPGGLQDETSGQLAEVVVHYRPEMGVELAAVYSQLFAHLEPDSVVQVACPDEKAFAELRAHLARLGREPRCQLRPMFAGRPITGWAKDRFAVWRPHRGEGRRLALLTPPRPVATTAERLGDWHVPGLIAERSAGRFHRVELPLVFDGGDFAAADDRVLAGPCLLANNPGLARLGPARAREMLAALAGRPVTLLGGPSGKVPQHHVNMFALPLGGGRALVGDVRLASRLLGGEEKARRRLKALRTEADLSEKCALRFDRTARQLAAEGMRVTRIPVLPLAGRQAYAPCVTYTNAIIETRGADHVVYLPTYDIQELDAAAKEVWRGLGFEVRPVAVGSLWRNGGSLDCLVGVLRRTWGFPGARSGGCGRNVSRDTAPCRRPQ